MVTMIMQLVVSDDLSTTTGRTMSDLREVVSQAEIMLRLRALNLPVFEKIVPPACHASAFPRYVRSSIDCTSEDPSD